MAWHPFKKTNIPSLAPHGLPPSPLPPPYPAASPPPTCFPLSCAGHGPRVLVALPPPPLVQVDAVQQGVMRINCIDCLDRTNVVQGVVARKVGARGSAGAIAPYNEPLSYG